MPRRDIVKYGLISFLCLTLCACRNTDLPNWPSELPEQHYFVSAYQSDINNTAAQSQQEYLQWVLSFYEGNLVVPTGWLYIQNLVVRSAQPELKEKLELHLTTLGGKIAAEWAKANEHRTIDSRMLGIWGSVLQLAEGPEQQQKTIQLIGEDVNALLEKDLLAAEIQDVRYEQRLGLRLFDDL
ncbi:MAG: hypothetical protein MK299_11300 [Pseudomonadales bacterium]|nr:hypothetical protein [Pseudomonadales bacterium]